MLSPAELLQGLVGTDTAVSPPAIATDEQAQWLIHAGLGPLAQAQLTPQTSGGRAQLQVDAYTAVAEATIRHQAFTYLAQNLHQADLPIIPLKGMALGLTVYSDPSQRVMSDIDLWLDDDGMARAAHLLPQWGFAFSDKDDRPHELQKMADGEMRFIHPDWPKLLIELHWSPFPGWWCARTAAIETTAVWNRLTTYQPAAFDYPLQLLAPEDTLIQLIVHLAVNHQFALSGVRTLVDMALIAQTYEIDWPTVIKRAQTWRVSTAVWLTLTLAQQLLPLRGLQPDHLQTIAPSTSHQRQLAQFVTAESLLHGRDITTSWRRYILLTLLVDRPQDRVKLIGRTLWPEPEWLNARYGGRKNNWQHLAHLLKSRGV